MVIWLALWRDINPNHLQTLNKINNALLTKSPLFHNSDIYHFQ